MSYYSKIVPCELAIKLDFKKFGCAVDSYYRIKDNENELVSKTQKEVGQLTGQFVKAPTYGEVLDWLVTKGIAIELIPYLTYALQTKFGYDYILYKYNEETGVLEKYHWNDFASFELCMKYAIEKALTLIN